MIKYIFKDFDRILSLWKKNSKNLDEKIRSYENDQSRES